MKKIFMYSLGLVFVLLIFNGCTTTYYTLTGAEKDYPQTNEKDITITTENPSSRQFEEVGYVSTIQTNIDAAKDKLKEIAAQMGGDAIFNFKINVVRDYIVIIFIPVPVDHYICRGIVVKYI